MTRKLTLLSLVAATAIVGLASQAAFANCQFEGPYEVRQCAKGTWFSPVPGAPANTIASVQWWAIGYGNTAQSDINAATDGSGFKALPSPGVFIGIDSGNLDAAGLDLVLASTIPGITAPAGSTCFSSASNWAAPGVDSCIDVNRNDTAGGGTVNVSDNYVNIYFQPPYVGTLYYNHQLDPPMGVLLKDSAGTHFALAFFASDPRAKDPNDLTSGQYNMGKLVNGDPGQSGNNVVPWQSNPEPNTSTVLSNPADPNSTRNVTMTWTAVRLVTDNTTRPCLQADGVTPCASMPGTTGVGVNDQGPLVHYAMQSTTLNTSTNTCDTTWTTVPGTTVDDPATTLSATGIAPNSCVRLLTTFGRTPSNTMGATLTTNRLNAQTGTLGDLGYSVVSTPRKVGGPTVSQNAVLTVASKNKNMVTVTWNTTAELNVTSFDIVGIDQKGAKKVVASSVACKACNTGLGATYTELVPGSKFEGSKKVQIIMQPSGATSNTLDLK